jgi:hypothetical protein
MQKLVSPCIVSSILLRCIWNTLPERHNESLNALGQAFREDIESAVDTTPNNQGAICTAY